MKSVLIIERSKATGTCIYPLMVENERAQVNIQGISLYDLVTPYSYNGEELVKTFNQLNTEYDNVMHVIRTSTNSPSDLESVCTNLNNDPVFPFLDYGNRNLKILHETVSDLRKVTEKSFEDKYLISFAGNETKTWDEEALLEYITSNESFMDTQYAVVIDGVVKVSTIEEIEVTETMLTSRLSEISWSSFSVGLNI
ncbi:hypothetical protein [Photobacterium leiognathi]|uniref:hypothetical protein n=1 Tax=Photobacterium leiognathi TaxID=553611 RepID=UPI002981159F|nr:hypothetical protein [Photobacterium leiognathi]